MACLVLLTGCGGHDDIDMPTRFSRTTLVTDVPGATVHTDATLVNGWGVAFNPTGSIWTDNGTSKSRLHDRNGVPQPLVVTSPPGGPRGARPTGIVFSGATDLVARVAGRSGPSRFIFAGQTGTIAGWSPAANPAAAITAVGSGAATGAAYTGLALAQQGTVNRLYAADFVPRAD